MEHVEHIMWNGQPLAYVIRAELAPDKTTFLTEPTFKQQAGFVVYPRGAIYRYSTDQASADRARTLCGVASMPNSGLILVQEQAYAASPELRALDRATIDRCFFNLYLELARLCVQSGRSAFARSMLLRYRRARGMTPRYLRLWGASWLPAWMVARVDK